MPTRLAAGLLALVSLALLASAEDKKKDDKKGTPAAWVREVNGVDLKFEFGKDTIKGTVMAGENGFVATGKMTMEKDGTVKVKITDVMEKGTFPGLPKAGLEFSFKWKVTGDTAELSDLKGDGVDEAKPVVEGEYKKKK